MLLGFWLSGAEAKPRAQWLSPNLQPMEAESHQEAYTRGYRQLRPTSGFQQLVLQPTFDMVKSRRTPPRSRSKSLALKGLYVVIYGKWEDEKMESIRRLRVYRKKLSRFQRLEEETQLRPEKAGKSQRKGRM